MTTLLNSRSRKQNLPDHSETISGYPSGAPESNAGDDFLILWGARCALQMLNPASDLRCVRMEGVSPMDLVHLDSSRAYFLAADMTEYYGGECFKTANRVVISQLKYSTRNVDNKWTCAALRKNHKKGTSVIRRIAQSFTDLMATAGDTATDGPRRNQVLKKCTIRLVSNQFADKRLSDALATAHSILKSQNLDRPVELTSLLNQLTEPQAKVIRLLHDGSGLGDDFTDFLRILDLSGCGEAPRLEQKAALLRSVAESVDTAHKDALRSLCDLLRKETMPEGRMSLGVTRADILACLEVFSEESLFPSPSRVQPPVSPIATNDAPSIVEILLNTPSRSLLVHGGAGVGKTTTMQEVEKYLPQGSKVIMFDCFGGGNYRDLQAQRHTIHRSLPQISNELSVNCGIPFLIKPSPNSPDALRDFARRLTAASKVISEGNGVLVIIIDAADNAVTAAQMDGECFAPHLWSLWAELPENCFLIMSTRTHRKVDVKAPPGTKEYELSGFTLPASKEFLRRVFPQASERSCSEFHIRTSHNPRLQTYLLDRAQARGADCAAWIHTIRNSRKTPELILENLIEAAVKDASSPPTAKEYLAILTCMLRPTPISIFAQACEIDRQEALNFCLALAPGVILANEEILFRDEDFEVQLRAFVGDLRVTHRKLGEYFVRRANQCAFAAQTAADHLFAAQADDQLTSFVIDGPDPTIIDDELKRIQINRRRLELGLRSAARLGNNEDAVRLLLRAAEFSRTNAAVVELIQADPELATCFGNPTSVIELCAQKDHKPWFGPAHIQMAALLAKNSSTHEAARDHLRQANAWLRQYFDKENRPYNWKFGSEDLSRYAEAVFSLEGTAAVQDFLSTWYPSRFRLKAFDLFIRRVAPRLTSPEIDEIIRTTKELSFEAECVMQSALWQCGFRVSYERVEALLEKIDLRLDKALVVRPTRKGWKEDFQKSSTDNWPINICELSVAHGFDANRILRIIDTLCPEPLEDVPNDHTDFGDYIPWLRTACLRAVLRGEELTKNDVLPEKYKVQQDSKKSGSWDQHYSKRERSHNSIGLILPVQVLRAQAIRGASTADAAKLAIDSGISLLKTINKRERYGRNARTKAWIVTACEALLACDFEIGPLLNQIVNSIEEIAGSLASISCLSMAATLAPRKAWQSMAIHLVERSARYVLDNPMPGRDRWETLLRCSQIISDFELDLGRDLYKKALRAAEDIDDDAAYALKFGAKSMLLLASGPPSATSIATKEAISREMISLVEAHRAFLSDPKVLPYTEVLAATCTLSPCTGLALSCRWDDLNICEHQVGIKAVVKGLTNCGYWKSENSFWLWHIAKMEIRDTDSVIAALESIKKSGAGRTARLQRTVDLLSNWINRESTRYATIKPIWEWSLKQDSGIRRFSAQLGQLVSFIERIEANKVSQRINSNTVGAPIMPEYLIKGNLESAILNLEELKYVPENQLSDILVEFGRSLPFGRRADFLEVIIQLDVYWYVVNPVLNALKVLLEEWRFSSSVQEWAQNGITRWVESRMTKLWPVEYDDDRIIEIFSLPVGVEPRCATLIPGVISRLDNMGAEKLCGIATAIAGALPPESLVSVLSWLTGRVRGVLEDDGKVALSTELASFHDRQMSEPESMASYYWTLLGHPDKRIRWRTLHALRSVLLTSSEAVEILSSLIRLSSEESGGPFQSDPEFYWMSARSYTLILIERLAHENPNLLVPHALDIAQHCLNTDFPHAQIRELARRSCLMLESKIPGSFSSDLIARIESANRASGCLYPRDNKRTRNNSPIITERRQDFNFYLLSGWLESLANKFAKDQSDLLEMAAHWICDRWEWTSEDTMRSDTPRIRESYDYPLGDTSHGTVPTVENLRTYFEYHAMMCVAGELVDSSLLSVDNYEDADDPWAAWLTKHLPFSDQFWLSDLRTRAPLLDEYWNERGVLSTSSEKEPLDYHRILGLCEEQRDGWIVVYGSSDFKSSSYQSSTSVKSALLGRSTSHAFMQAKQATASNNLGLPVEGCLGHDDWSVNEPGFSLTSILNEGPHRDISLEEKDRSARGVHPPFTVLHSDLVEKMGLIFGPEDLKYRTFSGEIVSEFEIWSDEDPDVDRVYGSRCSGQRLWLKLSVLCEYLTKCSKDLVLEVILERSIEAHSDGDRNERGNHVVYLLHEDGRIETVAGDVEVGAGDRSAVRA